MLNDQCANAVPKGHHWRFFIDDFIPFVTVFALSELSCRILKEAVIMDHNENLQPTQYMDFGHPEVQAFIQQHTKPSQTNLENAIQLYYAVRDQIRYDPYTYSYEPDSFKASSVLNTGSGWCVPKAILYAACTRAIGIPTRLGYADVRNHLSTAKMRAMMKTDIFYWHGYASLFLNDKWVKATPAFNIELCKKFGLKTLEFDGEEDSIYHPFDLEGRQHMEYLNDRGTFADFPFQQMLTELPQLYPHFDMTLSLNDFEKDVEQEIKNKLS